MEENKRKDQDSERRRIKLLHFFSVLEGERDQRKMHNKMVITNR